MNRLQRSKGSIEDRKEKIFRKMGGLYVKNKL